MRKLTLAAVVVFALSVCMGSTTFATVQNQESIIVKNSTVREEVIKSAKMSLRYTSGNYYSTSGSFILNDTTDLHLAINRCDYLLGAEKVNGTWNIYMNITDFIL